MTLGSLPIALILWILVYAVTVRLVSAFQHARRARRERRRGTPAGIRMLPD